MKQFVMSEYGNAEIFYKAKADYYEKLFLGLRESLVEVGVLECDYSGHHHNITESFKEGFNGYE